MKNINENSRKGQERITKMRELMGKMTLNENNTPSTIELTKLGPDNVVYGIVKENHEYFIKTSNKIKDVMLEDFNYIGGLANKRQYVFESYSKALKKLNLKMISLNEQFEGDKVNVFENDNLYVEKPMINESEYQEFEEEDVIEEMVGDKCACGAETYCDASGKECPVKDEEDINEGELKVTNVVQDGPKELKGNSVGEFKDSDVEPDDAPNDKSTGTESIGDEKATPKKTIKEGKRLSILDALERFDGIVESVVNKKKSLNETRYKLKVDDPTPAPEPQGVNADVGAIDSPQPEEFGGEPEMEPQAAPADDKPFDDEPFDAGVDVDEDSDPKKFLQQLAGKAGQSLRKYTQDVGMDLELEKFLINSIISATHTSQMDPEDQEDIISKIKSSGNEAEEPEDSSDEFGDHDTTGATPDMNPASNPAPEGGAPMGETIEILPKEHKQVFKNAKLGVNESFGETEAINTEVVKNIAKDNYDTNEGLAKELNYYAFVCEMKGITPDIETVYQIMAGHGIGPHVEKYADVMENDSESDEFANIQDLERIEREISSGIQGHDAIYEKDDESQLPTDDKIGNFVDDEIKKMKNDYLNTQNGFVAPETKPKVVPSVKPEPTKVPRRSRPYKVRPGISPAPAKGLNK
jgi:hypothetical protein